MGGRTDLGSLGGETSVGFEEDSFGVKMTDFGSDFYAKEIEGFSPSSFFVVDFPKIPENKEEEDITSSRSIETFELGASLVDAREDLEVVVAQEEERGNLEKEEIREPEFEDEEEIMQVAEEMSEFLETALEEPEIEKLGTESIPVKRKAGRRIGGRRDREEIFEELKKLATQAKGRLGSSDVWGVREILDSILSRDGKVMSSRQLNYALGNFRGCGNRMWRGWSGGGCDKWLGDEDKNKT
ncbi:hypothetical protein [Candidatus Mycoplasma haematohominis]|uniref:Uncharacterized protein n=1 Tax=Candidatus Mycoplasma haematohominis TaxID=1494318 RepID=A0A478FS03_9MOLU|nr:hypothetical protein [Candidatus Mycoplasma haemohominis]GCE63146.1 hypothetical protein MHSWG343_01240 [Candidatus Mycoplasma haemohominis]